jgi:hypothetical protein
MNNFDYNTGREHLVLPEYGRSIHRMVQHVVNLPDKEERNRAAKSLIAIMGNLNPHLRDVNDFKHKLWDHLYIISDFKIDIDSPYPVPLREVINEKPGRVPYRTDNIRYKHYGNNIEMMVMTVAKMEDGPEKQAYTEMIANLMKKFYLTWNKEAVNDDQIFKDLSAISNGAINIGPEVKLSETRDILFKNKKKNKITKKKY